MPHKMRHLRDAGSLRALAHPLRQAIYEQLILRGALTATQLSDLLDESPANCSWHLRKLAEHDFVEEAEGGKGRQRPWRATSQGLTWAEADDDEETRRSAAAMTQMMIDREVARLKYSLERLRSDDPAWDQASSTTQSMFWLTVDELAEISAALTELAHRSLERHEDPSLRPPGSRLCAFAGWAVPTYDLMDPTPDEPPTKAQSGSTDRRRRERHQMGAMARRSAEGGPEARRGATTPPACPDGDAQQARDRWIQAQHGDS